MGKDVDMVSSALVQSYMDKDVVVDMDVRMPRRVGKLFHFLLGSESC